MMVVVEEASANKRGGSTLTSASACYLISSSSPSHQRCRRRKLSSISRLLPRGEGVGGAKVWEDRGGGGGGGGVSRSLRPPSCGEGGTHPPREEPKLSRCRKGNNQRRATCCTVFVRGGSPIELRCKPPPPTYTGNPFFSPRSARPPSSVLICTRPAAKGEERKKPLSLSGAIQQTCGNLYADLFCQPHIWRISIQRKCRGGRGGLSREDFPLLPRP